MNFMGSVFTEYELKNGKLMFRNENSRQQYNELAKSATNANKELESFRKTMLDAQAQNLERLGR